MIGDHQGRIFSGILIILIGLIFLLGSLDRVDVGEVFAKYWPLILVFIGVWHLLSNNFQNTFPGLILIVVGGFFMLKNWNVLGVSAWKILWPVLVIVVGLWLILRPSFVTCKRKIPRIEKADLDAFALFSGINRRIESETFRGGKATALFGGMELDFTLAKLKDGEASIELTAICGGIDVFVPRNWKVVVDSNAIFGGVDNKHRMDSSGEIQATLFIKTTAILGGIDIKN